MKKRSTMALIAAMAVIAVGIFISLFLSSSDRNDAYTITLPGQGSAVIDPSHDIGESNRSKLQTISVNTSNIQDVIASLERPEAYQCQLETTYYYQDTQSSMKSQLWKSGDLVRISQKLADEQTGQQALLSENWAYLWGAEGIYTRFVRQERDADLYGRFPTYEDLLDLPREQIVKGEVRELDGQFCLYAETQDPVTGELEQWYILVENGILLYAAGTLGGVSTYESRLVNLQLEPTEEGIFLLPDGKQPE